MAGVSGGELSSGAVLIVGIANLFADGLSMGVGNYLSIRAHESALEAQGLPEEEAYPVRHGFATFSAFAVAGSIPLVPYLVPGLEHRFLVSTLMALAAQFLVGSLRSVVTTGRWWASGLEMLGLGARSWRSSRTPRELALPQSFTLSMSAPVAGEHNR